MPLLFIIEYVLDDNEFHTRREFDFLRNFLHGVMMCNGASADRIHDACKLLKEVEKITCDIHGLRDLNQYSNDDDDDDNDAAMKRDFDSKACDCYDYECSGDCLID